MFDLTVQNKNGQILQLSQNESEYQVVSIEGLTPPNTNIITSSLVNNDGERFNTSKLEMRNLVITLKIKGDVEKNRITLYSFFKVKKPCKIYYSNGLRDVYIEGYVESFEADLFSNRQEAQISLICPDPYFKGIETILYDFTKQIANFTFPFAIDEAGIPFTKLESEKVTTLVNEGDAPTGIKFTITALDDNIISPIIYNAETNEFIRIEIELIKNDTLIINTNRGNKSVTLIRDGIITNELNSVSGASTWLQLEPGVHDFTFSADTNNIELQVSAEIETLYEGV